MTTKKSILDTHNQITASELQDILNMQLDAMEEDPNVIKTLPPLIVRGSPGCGKSSIVREVCERRGIQFIDFRASQCEPCDIRGLPVPNREKNQMDWFVNGVWPRDPNGKGIIFLDELTSADRSIQVSLYQLVLDRCLGDLYQVPPGYLIVAAGNKTDDRAVATTMSSALANRFMHVELKEDAEQWLTWGRAHNIHPSVLGFITYKPSMLFNMENENLACGWPTPRSWERTSQMCHICKNDKLLRKMVYGLVGNGAGVEFMEFYKLNSEFDNILDIMTDPNAKVVIPDQADRKYAMCSAMIYLLWRGVNDADEDKRIDGFFRICMELTSDFASMALLAALEGKDAAEKKYRCKKLLNNKSFSAWQKKHGHALKRGLNLSNLF